MVVREGGGGPQSLRRPSHSRSLGPGERTSGLRTYNVKTCFTLNVWGGGTRRHRRVFPPLRDGSFVLYKESELYNSFKIVALWLCVSTIRALFHFIGPVTFFIHKTV